jgi:hypothetical protein
MSCSCGGVRTSVAPPWVRLARPCDSEVGQVGTDGHRRHAEALDQIGHLHRAVLDQQLQDLLPAGAGVAHGHSRFRGKR